MKYTIKNQEILAYNESEFVTFPKYTSQLINWANQNAQGTRAKIVGQMSDLFPEFMNSADNISLHNWEDWYLQRYPNAIENATERIYEQVKNLQKAIKLIDKDMIQDWVKDLVIHKTYNGFYVQKAILASLSQKLNKSYRLASPAEESVGIDGYVGETPYSIKPDTYKTMNRLPESINVKMIYYTKTKTGIIIEVEE
jgi:hypothetical protein